MTRSLLILIAICLTTACGCRGKTKVAHALARANSPEECVKGREFCDNNPNASIEDTRRQIERANIDSQAHGRHYAPPILDEGQLPAESWLLSLDETISIALGNTKILRGLGATILTNPDGTPAVFDPAIQWTNPNFGVEAALAQFDAQLQAGINYANNDDVFNNAVIGGGANEIQQDLVTANFGITKQAATGTQFSLTGNIVHDNNNRPGNLFDNAWTTLLEAQVRQPLLQGSGVAFNRIAGAGVTTPSTFNTGVVISRINNDISIAQFETDVRSFVDEIVQNYWQLYLAYKNFEAAKAARDSSLTTWNIIKARFDNDLESAEADREAQSREQYYIFEEQLLEALHGSAAGNRGVLQAEADLRRLLGLPQSDGRLIQPADEPTIVEVVYDWDFLANQALGNRAELRQQEWRVKQRELELLASRNFLLPRLDAVGTFRNNGFGDDLTGGSGPFSSAAKVAVNGLYDEWEFGLQLNVPIGYRQASAGVRFARLRLERERVLLAEQQQQVTHDLGSAMRSLKQAQRTVELSTSRLAAAKQTVAARLAAFEADSTPFDELLDAQQRLADAEFSFYQRVTSYALAQESVSREAGELLLSHGVVLNEGGELNRAGVDTASRQVKTQNAQLDYRLFR